MLFLTGQSLLSLFYCQNDLLHHLGSSVVPRKVIPQLCHLKADFLVLVCFRLSHDGEDRIHIQLTRLAQRLHLNRLGKGRSAILALHGFQQIPLFPFGEVRQLHRRGKGDSPFIHLLQNTGDQVC